MNRNPHQLANHPYDLCIIGGGIYGACAAWDAALRGLSVALVEKGDFGQATSFNTLRIIHGGLRYLQRLDVRRVRRSIHERMVWMRIAPHIIHPIPFLIPTYHYSLKGKEILSLALWINDLIGFDRNELVDPEKEIPPGRIISRKQCLELAPGIRERGLTGGAVWYDCQLRNSERLLISIVRSAVAAGAHAANYVEVDKFLTKGDRVVGVVAKDVLTGENFEVRANMVLNTSGPWVDKVLSLHGFAGRGRRVPLSKAMNLVSHRLTQDHAVGVPTMSEDEDNQSIVKDGSRYLFFTPWRDGSLIGTAHLPYDGDPDDFRVTEPDIERFIDQANRAFPGAAIRRDDIRFTYGGLLPANGSQNGNNTNLATQYTIYDHESDDGLAGLISVVGVKFTEARYVATKVVDLVFRKLKWEPPASKTSFTPVYGGAIDRLEKVLTEESMKQGTAVGANRVRGLIYNYGSEYSKLLPSVNGHEACRSGSTEERFIRAEVLHAIHEEMAQHLTDVILRRTELGFSEKASEPCLTMCAAIMSRELGWDLVRTRREVEEVRTALSLRN